MDIDTPILRSLFGTDDAGLFCLKLSVQASRIDRPEGDQLILSVLAASPPANSKSLLGDMISVTKSEVDLAD